MNKRKGRSHPPVDVKQEVITRDGGFCLLALPGRVFAEARDDLRAPSAAAR